MKQVSPLKALFCVLNDVNILFLNETEICSLQQFVFTNF